MSDKRAIDMSREKVVSETGAIRSDASGKGRLDLLPPWAVIRLAKHFEEATSGAHPYPERNWEKGVRVSRLISSALRHLLQYLGGDRSEPHEVAAAWNVMVLVETVHRVGSGELPATLMDIPTSDRMRESGIATTVGEVLCTMPLLPRPPVCPKCGSRKHPRFVEGGFKCVDCGHVWPSSLWAVRDNAAAGGAI
jgi:hypothetical protein